MAKYSIMQRLREETREVHEHLETLPFGRRLEAGTLSRTAYVDYLHAMLLVQSQLEQTASESSNKAVIRVWRDDMLKQHLLWHDLESLDAPSEPPLLKPAIAEALVLTAQIRTTAQADPSCVLGYLYVLEGSTLGGALLSRSLADNEEIGPDAVRYLTSYGASRGSHWKQFAARMDAAVIGASRARSVVEVARACFSQLSKVFTSLETQTTNAVLNDRVFPLNPDAGSHEITSDPVELDAALRAGETTLSEFPYVVQRFGERGLQFARSDSGWIVSLLSHDSADGFEHHIRWLGRVLAARGMPQLILEKHLGILHSWLVRARPSKEAIYAPLLQSADKMRAERTRHISDSDLDDLERAFQKATASISLPAQGIGHLLGSAVADESNGVRRATESLTQWLVDPERFPPVWAHATKTTLAEARRRARTAPPVAP